MADLTLSELQDHAKQGTLAKLIVAMSLSVRSLVSGNTETIWVCDPAGVGGYGWSESTQPIPCLKVTKAMSSTVGNPVDPENSTGILATVAQLSEMTIELVDFDTEGGSAWAAGDEVRADGAEIAGAETIDLDGMAATATIKRGEIFSAEGLPGYRFVVLEDATASGGAISNLDFWPKLPTGGIADNARIVLHRRTGTGWLAGYTVVGTAAAYYVGEVENGDKLPWGSKGTIASGLSPSIAKPSVDFSIPRKGEAPPSVAISLKPPGAKELGRRLRRPYTGHGMAIYCNGVNTTADANDPPWDPEDEATDSFVIATRVFLPGDPDNWPSGAAVGRLVDKNNWGLSRDTPANNYFSAFVTTSTPATYTATSPAIAELEQWYTVFVEYDKTAETITVGYVKGHPTAESTISRGTPVATAGTLTAGTDDLRIGSAYDGTLPFYGVIGWVQIFTGEPTDATLIDYMLQPVDPGDGAADGLVAAWQNVSLDGTEFLDEGPAYDPAASPTSIFNATLNTAVTIDNAAAVDKGGGQVGIPITGHPFSAGETALIAGSTNYDAPEFIDSETANEIVITATFVSETFAGTETARNVTAAHNLESPAAEGRRQPYVFGAATNAEGVAVAAGEGQWLDFLLYDFGPSFSVFDALFDHGAAVTFQAEVASLMSIWTTKVTAGSYLSYTLGGLAMLGSAPSGAVTADGWGVSPWHAGWRFAGQEIDFSTGLNAEMSSTYTLELFCAPVAVAAGNSLVWSSNSSGASAKYWVANSSLDQLFSFAVETSAGEIGALPGSGLLSNGVRNVGEPTMLSLVVDESGGNVTATLYQNGVLIASQTKTTATLSIPSGSFRVGRTIGGTFNGIVSELRLWTEARTQAQVQSRMAGSISDPSSEPTLAHYYTSDESQDPDIWVDQGNGSTQNGTAGSGLVWGGAPAVAAAHAVVQRGCDLASATLDLSEADAIPSDSVSIHLLQDETLIQAMARAIQGASGWLIFDPAGSVWILRRFPDLSTAIADHTITIEQIRDRIGRPEIAGAPHWIGYGWRPVGLVQLDLASNATESRRGLVASPLRYAGRNVPDAASAFTDSQQRSERPGAWRYREPAITEAKRVRPLIQDGLDVLPVAIMYGIDMPSAGQVIELRGDDVVGGVRRVVALSAEPSAENLSGVLNLTG